MEEKKQISEMSERELLAELLEQQSKSSRNSKILVVIMGIIAAVAVIVAILLVPAAVGTIKEVNTLAISAETAVDDADSMISDVQKVIGKVNGVLDDNTEAVAESISKIKDIDIESLNKSIQEFSDVLEPLAAFFNMLK